MEQVGLCKRGKCGGIKTSLWIKCLRNTDTVECIEANLEHSKKEEKKKEERKTLN
jgi:hypothetical protein